MIHINYAKLPLKAQVFLGHEGAMVFPLGGGAVCWTTVEPGDSLTEVAMESDCNECRSRLNIRPVVRDKQGHALNVATASTYDPKPMEIK